MTVAIVGGGVVGLTGAIALREAGLEATVYDRVDDVAAAQIGAGLGLAFNATRVLRRLGLLDGLQQAGSRLERFEFRSWNGKLLSHWGVPEGEEQFGVTRKALHELLVDALPADAIVCGKTCVGYEQDESAATALFEDGTSVRSDVLVGADGLRSTIRAQTLGDEPPRYADSASRAASSPWKTTSPCRAASSGCCGDAAHASACTTSLPASSTCSPGGPATKACTSSTACGRPRSPSVTPTGQQYVAVAALHSSSASPRRSTRRKLPCRLNRTFRTSWTA